MNKNQTAEELIKLHDKYRHYCHSTKGRWEGYEVESLSDFIRWLKIFGQYYEE